MQKMLSHLRALDLTDDKGFLCGKILADLGVEVIKVERPGGDPSRKTGGFWGNVPDPQKNLYWFAYNSNKKGITLDLEKPKGQELFKELVQISDFVIESFAPGYLDKLGIGYEDINKIYPKIIWASITPFGSTGPYKDFKGPDIVAMGMSGTIYQTGEADGPPLHMSLPQACLHAGADAAVGCMVAYYHWTTTNEGQHVDVSLQQSAAWFQANAIPSYELNGTILKRAGAYRAGTSTQVPQRQVWQCKDGYLFFNVIGGKTGAKTLSALAAWMDEEKMATDFLLHLDWNNFDMFTVTQDVMDQIANPIDAFFLKHTRQELLQGAVPRGVSIGPLSGMQDLLDDPCLNERQFWTKIEHPELGTSITYPKAFVRSNEADMATQFRAPLTGEHNEEVYEELGLYEEDLAALKQEGII
jgi:crotonobetainyl-CoA:carnitine CoA-transferase CaiB-like acyl-CoA transferase